MPDQDKMRNDCRGLKLPIIWTNSSRGLDLFLISANEI
jgi:hypothetical protein